MFIMIVLCISLGVVALLIRSSSPVVLQKILNYATNCSPTRVGLLSIVAKKIISNTTAYGFVLEYQRASGETV